MASIKLNCPDCGGLAYDSKADLCAMCNRGGYIASKIYFTSLVTDLGDITSADDGVNTGKFIATIPLTLSGLTDNLSTYLGSDKTLEVSAKGKVDSVGNNLTGVCYIQTDTNKPVWSQAKQEHILLVIPPSSAIISVTIPNLQKAIDDNYWIELKVKNITNGEVLENISANLKGITL